MTGDARHDAVAALMRDVATAVVMPHFRRLRPDQVKEKAPGDLVTVADRESERRLTEGLHRIEPGTQVVGEEACAANPALLERLDQGRVWLVDPIDGTGNYAAGHPPFGIMVALLEDGTTTAGWLLDPVSGRLCHATLGKGAFVDGERVTARASGQGLPRAAIATRYLAAEHARRIEQRIEGRLTCVPIPFCAAEQYPRLVNGANDLALFNRTLPWDHAAGALFVEEAGGRVARADGTGYRAADRRPGLLGAASPDLWAIGAALLFD